MTSHTVDTVLVEKQKEVANEVSSKLKGTFGECVFLAGGAPRNWYENKPANDLDFYIVSPFGSYTKSKLLETFTQTQESRFGTIIVTEKIGLTTLLDKTGDTKNMYEGSQLDIKHIYSYQYKGVIVQFIFVVPDSYKDLDSFRTFIINSFDANICKIGWDTQQNYILGAGFLEDLIENKTITVNLKDLSGYQIKQCISKHVPKLQKYYPEHKLIINP